MPAAWLLWRRRGGVEEGGRGHLLQCVQPGIQARQGHIVLRVLLPAGGHPLLLRRHPPLVLLHPAPLPAYALAPPQSLISAVHRESMPSVVAPRLAQLTPP